MAPSRRDQQQCSPAAFWLARLGLTRPGLPCGMPGCAAAEVFIHSGQRRLQRRHTRQAQPESC